MNKQYLCHIELVEILHPYSFQIFKMLVPIKNNGFLQKAESSCSLSGLVPFSLTLMMVDSVLVNLFHNWASLRQNLSLGFPAK